MDPRGSVLERVSVGIQVNSFLGSSGDRKNSWFFKGSQSF